MTGTSIRIPTASANQQRTQQALPYTLATPLVPSSVTAPANTAHESNASHEHNHVAIIHIYDAIQPDPHTPYLSRKSSATSRVCLTSSSSTLFNRSLCIPYGSISASSCGQIFSTPAILSEGAAARVKVRSRPCGAEWYENPGGRTRPGSGFSPPGAGEGGE
jgi:hypothetical protein